MPSQSERSSPARSLHGRDSNSPPAQPPPRSRSRGRSPRRDRSRQRSRSQTRRHSRSQNRRRSRSRSRSRARQTRSSRHPQSRPQSRPRPTTTRDGERRRQNRSRSVDDQDRHQQRRRRSRSGSPRRRQSDTSSSTRPRRPTRRRGRRAAGNGAEDADSADDMVISEFALDEAYMAHGKLFARYIDMVEKPSDCIKHALKRIKNEQRGVNVVYEAIHNRRFANWEKLLLEAPELEQDLATCTVRRRALIQKSLDKGHSQARSDNVTSLKKVVYSWIDRLGLVPAGTTPPSIADKTTLGFTNRTTAKLLCPCKLDIDGQGIREGLEQNRLKKAALPHVFFLDHKYDPTKLDILCGLLRSILLIWTYRHIFTGPSSASTGKSTSIRKSNAELAGYATVTYESIAYAATLLRFILSATRNFTSLTDSEYDYAKDCYDHIIRVLKRECNVREDGSVNAAGQDLMEFWNHSVFGASAATEDDEDDDMGAMLDAARAEAAAPPAAEETTGSGSEGSS